jgi:hypothetical protein
MLHAIFEASMGEQKLQNGIFRFSETSFLHFQELKALMDIFGYALGRCAYGAVLVLI